MSDVSEGTSENSQTNERLGDCYDGGDVDDFPLRALIKGSIPPRSALKRSCPQEDCTSVVHAGGKDGTPARSVTFSVNHVRTIRMLTEAEKKGRPLQHLLILLELFMALCISVRRFAVGRLFCEFSSKQSIFFKAFYLTHRFGCML